MPILQSVNTAPRPPPQVSFAGGDATCCVGDQSCQDHLSCGRPVLLRSPVFCTTRIGMIICLVYDQGWQDHLSRGSPVLQRSSVLYATSVPKNTCLVGNQDHCCERSVLSKSPAVIDRTTLPSSLDEATNAAKDISVTVNTPYCSCCGQNTIM